MKSHKKPGFLPLFRRYNFQKTTVGVKLTPPAVLGLRAMRSSYLTRQNSWVAIEKCKTEIPIKKVLASPSIKRTQFPLTLAWVSTVHKVQGLSLEQGVFDFDLRKQRLFVAGQI